MLSLPKIKKVLLADFDFQNAANIVQTIPNLGQ